MQVTSFAEADGRIFDVYASASAAFAAIDMTDKLREVVTSTVHPEKVSQFLELCYAFRTYLPADVLEAAADIGAFATSMGFYGLGTDGRGAKMVAALRGEEVTDLPEPAERFVPPPVIAEEGAGDEGLAGVGV